MLTTDEVAALLRSAEYFAARPDARIGRDAERKRERHREKMRRLRARKATAALGR
jgi:hypothetical protein